MNKKYVFTKTLKTYSGTTLHQIKALRSFGNVKKGDLGGWIEKESNLSHAGLCWAHGNSKVYGDAKVSQNANIYDNVEVGYNAKVYGNSSLKGNVQVFDSAKIYGCANIYDDARIFDKAKIYGYACMRGGVVVSGNAEIYDYAYILGNSHVSIYGNAKICEYAKIFDQVKISDNAIIKGNSKVFGNAIVFKNAVISDYHHISFGKTTTDLTKDKKALIQNSCNLPVINNKIIAYKMVFKDRYTKKYTSEYDSNFEYKIGAIVEVKNPDLSNASCASGIHASNFNYWTNKANNANCYLELEIDLKDVITCQEGKIRAKKAKVLRAFEA